MNPVVRDKGLLAVAQKQLFRAYVIGMCSMMVFLLAICSVMFHFLGSHLFAGFCWIGVVLVAVIALWMDGALEDGLYKAYVGLGDKKV